MISLLADIKPFWSSAATVNTLRVARLLLDDEIARFTGDGKEPTNGYQEG